MAIKLASFNVKGMRDQSKAACLFCDLLSFRVDMAAIQETHFVISILVCCLMTSLFIQHMGSIYHPQQEFLASRFAITFLLITLVFCDQCFKGVLLVFVKFDKSYSK